MDLAVELFINLNGVYPSWEAEEKFGLEAMVLTDGGAEMVTSEKFITHQLRVVQVRVLDVPNPVAYSTGHGRTPDLHP